MTQKNDRGFTLIELLVVIVIIGILAAMALPNFVRAREKAKEAEVKSNIHSIQVALERYGTDSGGVYPLILYGGDNTDSFTTLKTPNYDTINQGQDVEGWSEYDGDLDILLEYNYLSQYPKNPFQLKRDIDKYGALVTQPVEYNLEFVNLGDGSFTHHRVNIWSQHPDPIHGLGSGDRAQQMAERKVGGENGNLMWDISEGQRHIPFPIVVVPDPDPGADDNYYGYINPTASILGGYSNVSNHRDDHLFFLQSGNFYYYATFSNVGGYNAFVDDGEHDRWETPITSTVTGFNLAGYGSTRNPAKDVYNLMGDYPDRSFLSMNNPSVNTGSLTLADMDLIYVGPDGRNDGVVIVVQSGADRKTPENLEMKESLEQ